MLGLLVVVHVGEGHHGLAGVLHLFIMGGSQLPADHQVGQIFAVGGVPVQGTYRFTGAQNGDAVGDAQHLPHFMADEDDAFALAGELVHDVEEAFHLDVRQGGGGLVQYQQLRAPVEGLEDLHPLLGTHGNVGDGLVQLHVQAVALRELQDLLFPGLLVDEDALGVAVAQNDVLKDRHGLHQHEVLVHHADAQLYRLGGGVNADFFAVEIDVAFRGLVEAEEHIHQRAFSGAVFA